MTPSQQEQRTWRKENDDGNKRFSVTSSEEAPVSGADVPFEELLARQLRESEENGLKPVVATSCTTRKKPFLKKGARGWWMRQPDAKKKVVKHTLASTEEAAVKTKTTTQRKPQERQQSSLAAINLSSAPEQVRIAASAPQTLSPSSVLRQSYPDERDVHQLTIPNDDFATWKNASGYSTISQDIMSLQNVRQSYEAKQKREANEMAEFEAIERDLAAEKEAFLMEKDREQQGKSLEQRQQTYRNDEVEATNWELPYSSFVSDLHEQEQPRWSATRQDLLFDDSLDAKIDSSLMFDDYSAQLNDGGVSERDRFTNKLRDHFGYGDEYGDPPSDLSAVSFDDSVPWDDGLSLQPRQSIAHEHSSNIAATRLLVSPNAQDNSIDDRVKRQAPDRGVSFVESGGDETYVLEHKKSGRPEDDAAVSSLVQRTFGDSEEDGNSDGASLFNEKEIGSISDSSCTNVVWKSFSPPLPPPIQDKSLSTLKQKLQGKKKTPATRPLAGKARVDGMRMRQTKAKTAAASRISSNQKSASRNNRLTHSQDRLAKAADSGMILPAVIEEKLFELEEEVKFYKAETLQLQKRKEYYDQEMKKLALEREEFARFQKEQRLLIEKEWERERMKMKKEEKLQERQWKLRMNATISHQDRKDRGEVEMLKAQIVKMQIDEKACASKWKAGNDNLRQRLAELEEKNHELSDEIKFLEKDRLEQWGKYERLLKETQEASGSALQPGDVPCRLSEKNELQSINDVLLQRWSASHNEYSPKNKVTANIGFPNCVQSNAVDDSKLKRHNSNQEDFRSSSESRTFPDGHKLDSPSEKDIARDAASHAIATNEWAFPAARGDETLHDTHHTGRKSDDHEEDGAISASTSSLSEHKVVSQEIKHIGGKKELLYTDGSRKILFPDGNEKDIDASGHVIIRFTNGDHKELFPDTGVSIYHYYEAQTKLTTYPDNRKVYEFPSQQIETSFPDGTTEIQFADGIKKTVRANGDEFSVFPDGTTMLEQPDGLREVTLLNQKKIRYFPDGQMACVSSNGQQTRVRSDHELKQHLHI